MRLSIVTINYNNAEGLRKTLASVASQTYRDIEHIIVDAASTDGSIEVIKEYESLNHSSVHPLTITWTSEKDKGIYDGMNKGIEIALGRRVVSALNRSELVEDKHSEADRPEGTGVETKVCADYIQILNSGDILAADDVTERMFAALESSNPLTSNPLNENRFAIFYGNMIRDFGSGKLCRDTIKAEGMAREVEWTMYDFISGTVNHDPTYIHKSLYEKYGLYDDSLKICSDWKWFVNAVVFGGEKLYYVPVDITIFDTAGISETNLAFREQERNAELEKMLPAAILKDYYAYHFPIDQIKRLKNHHLWGLVYLIERVLFKLEKWRVLRK